MQPSCLIVDTRNYSYAESREIGSNLFQNLRSVGQNAAAAGPHLGENLGENFRYISIAQGIKHFYFVLYFTIKRLGRMDAMDGYTDGPASSNSESNHLQHSNVYLRPVPPGWDEPRLSQFFSSFGDVDSVRISHPTPGSRAGVAHAFIRFRDPDAAQAAINTLQGTLLDGLPIVVKLADADMAPRIQSGLCASEWCYARGLPAHLTREDVAAIFATYGQVKDLKQ